MLIHQDAVESSLCRRADRVEQEAWLDWWESIPSDYADGIGGASTFRIGAIGGIVTYGVPSEMCNRVFGIGRDSPATVALVDEVLTRYVECPLVCVDLVPGAQPKELPEWLEERGFEAAWGIRRVARLALPAAEADSHLRVVRVAADKAEKFGRLRCEAFGMVGSGWRLTEGLLRRPSWRHYWVLERQRAVGVGSLFIRGATAWLNGGAVLPEARGRGGHAGLIAVRVNDALAADCHYIVSDSRDVDGSLRNPSQRNLARAGFHEIGLSVQYVRQ